MNRLTNFDEPFLHHEILSHEEQLELFRRWKHQGDQEAYHRLIQCHLRFAYKMADDFKNERFREDLRSEAVAALIFALERWDPSRGVLTTIATPVIRQRLTRFLIENSYVSRVPYLTFRSYMERNEEEQEPPFAAIFHARYISNRNQETNAEDFIYTEEEAGQNVIRREEWEAIQQRFQEVDEDFRMVFELIHGIHPQYDVKVSMEQLSRMLHSSKNELKTKVGLVMEYLKDPYRCVHCGKPFFRRNRRLRYCPSCRPSSGRRVR